MLTLDSDGVPIRTGLCVGCSSSLYWFRDRLRCSTRDANINQCPIRSCNRRHSLSPGQKPQKVLRMIPDTDACYRKEFNRGSERCSMCASSEGDCSYYSERYQQEKVRA